MKTARLILLLVLVTVPPVAFGEEKKAAVPAAVATNRPAATSASAATGAATAAIALPTVTLNPANQAAVQGRLRPPTEAALIERYGSGGYLLRKRSAGSALQLLNPFAPASYGGVGNPSGGWNWNPNYGPGSAPPPRAFRDEKTHEASSVIFGRQF